jgi:outer membrane biosynthesis protein TonB
MNTGYKESIYNHQIIKLNNNMKYSTITLLFAIAAVSAAPMKDMPYDDTAAAVQTPCPDDIIEVEEVISEVESIEETLPVYEEPLAEATAAYEEPETEVEAAEETAAYKEPETEVEAVEAVETPCPETEVEAVEETLETPCPESEVEAVEEEAYAPEAEETEAVEDPEAETEAATETAAGDIPIDEDGYSGDAALLSEGEGEYDQAAFSQSSAASLGVSSLIALSGILALF